jgi:hypothetical protein
MPTTVEVVTEQNGLNYMPDKFRVPKFASEAEEAQWWFDRHRQLAKAFQRAAGQGHLGSGSVARIARERAATGSTPTTAIRLDPDDISKARMLGQARVAISNLSEDAAA